MKKSEKNAKTRRQRRAHPNSNDDLTHSGRQRARGNDRQRFERVVDLNEGNVQGDVDAQHCAVIACAICGHRNHRAACRASHHVASGQQQRAVLLGPPHAEGRAASNLNEQTGLHNFQRKHRR